MNRFVLDCSVYMSWCLNEETVSASSLILKSIGENAIVVPALWRYEVANVLAVSVTRKKITPEEARQLIDDISLLPISFDQPTDDHMAQIFHIAHTHGLSAYDSAYIELALRLNIPIATFDNDMITVSKKLGVTLFSG